MRIWRGTYYDYQHHVERDGLGAGDADLWDVWALPAESELKTCCGVVSVAVEVGEVVSGCVVVANEFDEIQIGRHRVQFEDAAALRRKAARQAAEDRELFQRIDEAVTEEEAGTAVRVMEERDV